MSPTLPEGPGSVPGSIGPVIEQLGPPVSNVPWSPELVAQSLELLPIGVRDGELFWLRPVHAASLRVGISRSDEPSQLVRKVMGWYPLTAVVIHSTSWRYEDGGIVLTYLVVVDPPQDLPPHSLEVVPIKRSDLARGGATAPAAKITVEAVLEHALRHLAWLSRDDLAIAPVLLGWSDVLKHYRPEPFQALS